MASRVEEAAARSRAALDLFVSGRGSATPSPPAVESGERTRLAIDCGPILLWTATVEYQRDWLNASWATATGQSIEQLLGRGWLACVHPEDVERCEGIFQASRDARRTYTLDLRLRHHDGHYRWMSETGVPRFDGGDRLTGYFGTVIDIHERKRLEEQLAERMRLQRLAERRHAAALSRLAHELRNPLAPIANAASVLRSLEAREPVVERLREILERQVHRLERLVAELSDVVRFRTRQISLVAALLDIETVVRGALETSATQLDAVGHRVELQFPEEPLYVKGDPARLVQALANLLANVAHAAEQPSRIVVSVREAGARAEIVVRDPARGIAADILPHLFDPFAQADDDAIAEHGGSGAALALAHRIVRLHGGELEARSEGPGRGACFVVSLPLAVGRPTPAAASEATAREP